MLGLWQANGRGKGEGDGSNFMKMVLALQLQALPPLCRSRFLQTAGALKFSGAASLVLADQDFAFGRI